MPTTSQQVRSTIHRRKLAALTQREVAAALGIRLKDVQQGEERALRKMRNHPVLRELAREMFLLPEESVDALEKT